MSNSMDLKRWLPTTKKEVEIRGWDKLDVILFSGDAYVDHPSFGAAVIGRVLEAEGLRVAIVPQPNWRDDLRDFRKLGTPRLFFGISAGAMDSMVNHYTANKRLRSDDAYTPDGKAGMRPDYPTTVYSNILKELYPDVPVIIGGIEASLRRISHYDYWQDQLRPSILMDCKADLLIYGMGEQPIRELAKMLHEGKDISEITDLPQTVVRQETKNIPKVDDADHLILHSYQETLKNKQKSADNFSRFEKECNKQNGKTIWQEYDQTSIKINPPYPPMVTEEIDKSYDLPYTRLPHPKYKGKRIPAYEMIRHSINLHRGCFGGCSFCTITAHQGRKIVSRSKESILREVKQVTEMEDFKGYLSDLGGPSANMYRMEGIDPEICLKCSKPSCLYPKVCRNLNADHRPLLDLYKEVDKIPLIKKSFIGSGVRYDLLQNDYSDNQLKNSAQQYAEELIKKHVSGRLKVAPEHTNEQVLRLMRKPSFNQFHAFKKTFDRINLQYDLRQQLIPYFISGHPGCTIESMAELAVETKAMDFHLEQIQDFTPTPLTLATEIYYTGIHPETKEKVFTARTKEEKLDQRRFFFWYDPSLRKEISETLKKIGRKDLVEKLFESKKKKDSPFYNEKRTMPETRKVEPIKQHEVRNTKNKKRWNGSQ